MNKLFLYLYVYFSIVSIKGQNFIDTNKVWNVYSCNGPFLNSCITETYKFKSDTIINSFTYFKLYATIDSIPNNWWFIDLFREDTISKKVYWFKNNQDELLYDFNLNIGDTAKVISALGGMPYPMCPFNSIVDSIKINTYYGVSRKQWYFNTRNFYGQPETWIEGIGNSFGPIDNLAFTCMADYGPRLICFKEGGNLKYMDSNFNDCYQTTLSIHNVKIFTKEYSIFPNPSQNEFYLKSEKKTNKEITITNEFGLIIMKLKTDEMNYKIILPHSGVYFISVTDGISTWTDKVVKF